MVDALEFIRRFLQHVLPTGFMKVRYYGFLSPTAKMPLAEVKARVELAYGFAVTVLPERQPAAWPQPACQVCGGALRFHRSLRRVRLRASSDDFIRPTAIIALTASG
jgi:hypothetical protein